MPLDVVPRFGPSARTKVRLGVLCRTSKGQIARTRQISVATEAFDDRVFDGDLTVVVAACIIIRLYNRMVINNSRNLDATFAALADPTRRAILVRLASGEASVLELAKPFAMSQPCSTS